MSNSFDTLWEKKYRENPNYRNRYPYDEIVSFIYNYKPPTQSNCDIRILEIGCGCGNNLWFAAREGFSIAGIDGSQTAIEYAKNRFSKENLSGDLRVGNMTSLPYNDNDFDLILDRGAFTLLPDVAASKCIDEVHRTLKYNGYFYCSPFSDRDSSFYRNPDPDGLVRDIKVGTILGGSQYRFYSLQQIRELFRDKWKFESIKHMEETEMITHHRVTRSEWRVIVKKSC